MKLRQKLIDNFENNFCKVCDGRGFILLQHTSPDGYIEPNEVIECTNCNGTGKPQKN
jgi:DnaJ-class molecular chaperone